MRDLAVDRMRVPGPVQVVWFDGATLAAPGAVREPHRHDYHELIWQREGSGQHRLDGEVVPIEPGTVVIVGRQRVHVLENADRFSGAVVRFGAELLYEPSGRRAAPGWLLTARGARVVRVPASDVERLEGVIRALGGEAGLPPDPYTAELERHLVAVLLLWLERWHDAARAERGLPDDPDEQLHRRFAGLLEGEYARHHAAAWYADALAVPAAHLARVLAAATGRPTKELVLDRVLLEASRLLRFTDLTISEVAHRVGYADPLYFSRAFKRRFGMAPGAYRTQARGT